MTRSLQLVLRITCWMALAIWASAAQARCDINSAGLSIAPLTANTGTFTPPTTPAAQSVNLTVTGTYDTNASPADLTCRFAISFNRGSLPATMARSGGGATLPYTLTSTGGSSLLYTGGGNPTSGNRLQATFTAAGTNRNNVPFSLIMTVVVGQQPGSPQRAGSYTDTLTLRMFNIRPNGTLNDLGSSSFSVTGTVALACTIGGVTNPSADTASIPVSATGTVNVAAINRSFANVICNSVTAVQAQSLNGAVRIVATPPTGFTNIINYSASATFSGATSNLNTATIPTAAGPESGTTATTASATPTGSLSVTITPQTTVQRLMAGSYADTLRVTLTPQ